MNWKRLWRKVKPIAKPLLIQYGMAKANKISGGKLAEVASVINNPLISGMAEKQAIANKFGIEPEGVSNDS